MKNTTLSESLRTKSSPSTDIENLTVHTIGKLHSCFKEKFGIPRQPGLATAATAVLELSGEYASMNAVRGLEDCTHIWVLFLFSEHLDRGWTPLVRPPRSQGGKMGVFATRSTFRPNPIGMSAVKLERIEEVAGKPLLHLSGVDILDGTPVIDIKPYLPYSDSLAEAHNEYAPDKQELSLPLDFSELAESQLRQQGNPGLFRQLIEQVLRSDPRPAHLRNKKPERSYGTLLHNCNVRWKIAKDRIEVMAIEAAESE